MRILCLSPWFPYPLDTGSRIRVYHQLRAMSERHQVTLLTLDPQGWAPAEIKAVEPMCEHVTLVPRDPFQRGRLRTTTRFFSLKPIVNTPFPEMSYLVHQFHSEQPFDIVVASTTVMAHYALGLPRIPRMLEEHNSFTRWREERYMEQTSPLQRLRCWISWRKTMRYESRLFSLFDLVTMVSEQDARVTRRLLHHGGPPVSVIPNGVDCEYNRFGLRKALPNTLIFNGALTYSANYRAMQYFLSRIYPMIRQQAPDVTLTITGCTKDVDLASLQLDDSVQLTGYVDDVRPLVASASACIVPIRDGGGTRLKILEAMALGTPVVATSKGAEGLEVKSSKDILIADDPETFAASVIRLLADPSLRQWLTPNARHLVEQRYDWTQIGQRFVRLTEDVARGAARGLSAP